MTESTRNIYISIARDARVRDILRMGVLDHLLAVEDVRVVILTPAYRDPDFLREFTRERVIIRNLRPFAHTRRTRALLRLRKMMPNRLLTRLWHRFESRGIPGDWYDEIFDEYPPEAILLPDLIEAIDWPLAKNARRRGVRTIGAIRSWDNVIKGLAFRVDMFCSPNEQNADEARSLEKYKSSEVIITGTPQFDLYFQASTLVSRAEFCESQGLDPDRKLIVLAPAGAKFQFMAAEWLDILLEAQEEGVFGPSQIVCRNHPADPLGPFLDPKYVDRPNLKLDMPRRWLKSLGWQMSKDDVVYVANLLKHADVVVTPASTFTLESAIFDTPAVIVAFSEIVPDVVRGTLQDGTFIEHFSGLLADDLVMVAESREELMKVVRGALDDPQERQAARKRVVNHWAGPTDGRSSERLALVVLGQSIDVKELS